MAKPKIKAPTTSIEAQGAQATPESIFQELGVNRALLSLREYVPELATRYLAIRKYDEMIRSDAQVRAVVRASKVPILAAQWYVEPASQDQNDLDAAEFVEHNFNSMSTPWAQTLEEVLHCVEYGFSVLEQVYELGEWSPAAKHRKAKQYAMLKKLAPRPALSIPRFIYDDNGGPAGVWHVKTDPNRDQLQSIPGTPTLQQQTAQPVQKPDETIQIPIEKLLIFTFDRQGGNLEGLSLLRTVYKHWYIKEQLYKIDAIQKERHGIGVPKATLPPGASEKDKRVAAEMLRNLRTNEDSFILEPPGWVIDFAEVKGNLVDALKSAEHHDLMIARSILVQFINMGAGGQGSSGGRASSGTQYDLYLKSLRHMANLIADVFNVFLIRKLVDYNFKVDRYPKLRVKRIGDNTDLQRLSSGLASLATSGIIIPDDELEDWVRNEFEAPGIQEMQDYLDDEGDRLPRAVRRLISVQLQANPADAPTNGNGNGKTDNPLVPNPGRKKTGRLPVATVPKPT